VPDEICFQQRLTTVECHGGIGIMGKEGVKILKVIRRLQRQILIDLDFAAVISGCPIKCLCPAVGAAEVAVVGYNEVVVQENP
jgi:dissimilatory sulfite reductase (desulfoviridin) alpha/beta subunit